MSQIIFTLNAVDRFSGTMEKANVSMRGMATAVAAASAAMAALSGVAAKQFINASKTAENYRIRLDALLGSTAAGAKTFDDMTKFASGVPFEFEKIMQGATQLSGVVKGGSDEIAELMPMIADLATVSGLSIEQTTDQVVRMFSAGAGAADLFRDRGITAMLGFKAGVATTGKEAREQIIGEWNKAGSQFKDASAKMAATWDGQVSMIEDKWFLFRKQFMDTGMFNILKKGLEQVNASFQKFLDDSQSKYKVWTENLINGVGFILDAWNGLKVAWQGLNVVFQAVISGWFQLINEAANLWVEFAGLFGKEVEKPAWMQEMADASKSVVDDSIAEMDRLATHEVPSIAWKKWAGEVVEETEKAMAAQKAAIENGEGQVKQAMGLSFEQRLELTRQYLDSDTELGYEKWLEKKEQSDSLLATEKEELMALREQNLIEKEDFDLKMEELEIRHRAKLGDVQAKAALATLKLTKQAWQAQAKNASQSMEMITGSVASESKEMFEIHKAVSIANTIMSTYEAAQNVFNGFSSIPIIGSVLGAAAAAVVVAAGLQRVGQIKNQKFNKAHAGLGFVPEESTFLLSKGERVVAPDQNRDLTNFLSGQGGEEAGGGSGEQNIILNIHMFENVTNADALLTMAPEEMESIVEEKIIPAFDRLYNKGIRTQSETYREG